MREQDWRANCYEAIRERNEAEAAVERVRQFVDGFAERGGGKLEPGDELWIMAIRRELGDTLPITTAAAQTEESE